MGKRRQNDFRAAPSSTSERANLFRAVGSPTALYAVMSSSKYLFIAIFRKSDVLASDGTRGWISHRKLSSRLVSDTCLYAIGEFSLRLPARPSYVRRQKQTWNLQIQQWVVKGRGARCRGRRALHLQFAARANWLPMLRRLQVHLYPC